MATTFVIACPECEKQVKVSDEHVGKRIKCKGCGTVYPVKAPGGAARPAAAKSKAAAPPPPPKAKAAPPPPKAKAAAPSPPPAPAPAKADSYEAEDPNDYSLQETNDDLPRCPFFAKEMASAEARICLNCGYDTRTRMRPEVKAVYESTGGDKFMWLLPGIMCIVTMLGLTVWYLIFCSKIEYWLEDSVFEDDKGPPVVYLAALGPPFMRLYHGLLLAFIFVPLVRFAYKRLVKDNKPPEQMIKDA